MGGPERKVAEGLAGIGSISWSPDGRFLVTAKNSSLYLVDVENGGLRRLTKPPDEKTSDDNAAFSPDGRLLAFTRHDRWYRCGLYLMNLGADYRPWGEPRLLRLLGGHVASLAWTADGKEVVYAFDSPEWGIPLMRLRIESGPQLPRRALTGVEAATSPAISRRGNRLAYVRVLSDLDIWQIQPGKLPHSFISSTQAEVNPQYSPDGRRVVFQSNRSGQSQIWACDQEGGNAVQLTSFETGSNGTPRWSPDGQSIAFDRVLKEGQRIFLMAQDSDHLRRLTPSAGDWDEMVPSFSRDGKWVYYSSTQTGRNEIWRAPVEGGNGTQMTHNGGLVAFESRDGQSLYYIKSGFSGLWGLPLVVLR
jgi:Tol biopolymer transport system component